jgi:hypothetical protein
MEISIPFSYWIFAWYLLFITGIVSYEPFWWLVIASVANLLQLAAMIYYQNDLLYIFLFVFGNIFLKVLPIYSLRSNFYQKIHFIQDILPGLVLFAVYLVLTVFIKGSYQKANRRIHEYINAIKTNRPFSPFVYYVSKWIRSGSLQNLLNRGNLFFR